MRSIDINYKTPEEQKQELENIDRKDEIYRRIYMEHSKLKAKDLDEMFKKEKYYTPDELVKFGLVDEIED